MQLSTKNGLLYYYCYFNIKLLKNNLSTAAPQIRQACEYLAHAGLGMAKPKKGSGCEFHRRAPLDFRNPQPDGALLFSPADQFRYQKKSGLRWKEKRRARFWLQNGVWGLLLHKTGDISGTSGALSTEKVGEPGLSPLARQRKQGSAHRVCYHASACAAKEKRGCPHASPCSTTTTMFL